MQFTEATIGRVFILRLHEGDRLPDTIENFAEQKHVSTAVCFFLGGANDGSKVVVGPKDGRTFPPEPMTTLLKGVYEAAAVGTIVQNEEGKPKLHMHAAFGRKEETVTGCVRMGVDVWQIGEFVILELKGSSAERVVDKKTGFEFLEVG